MHHLQDGLFKLPNNKIHIWFVNFDISEKKRNILSSLLSEDELIKASKFHFKKDRNQSIITRGALRLLSSYYLNKKAKNIGFAYGEYGKPEYNFNTKLKFNVSHSNNMAVLGFILNSAIGVDIEKIKDDFDVLDIAGNFFSELEIKALKKVPKEKQAAYFYRCWTRKESFIKGKAKGLSFPLDSFSVSIQSDKETELLETKWDEKEKNTWKLFTFSPHQDYIGAVSAQGPVTAIGHFNFNDYDFII
ncbi:4'-phosphopantetheinyl transferase superfamily protein [Flaviramulus aquimarinus]|uniref:4'-phosphopantetheinyl transferase superfamily protein n=1 Tax=Flaviramulus aquimarinus TaxID=1170456 RepID=A0ABP9ES10_9FLAO